MLNYYFFYVSLNLYIYFIYLFFNFFFCKSCCYYHISLLIKSKLILIFKLMFYNTKKREKIQTKFYTLNLCV